MERELNLKNGTIRQTILSPDVIGRFHDLERGYMTLEDFDPVFTYFYNRQVCRIFRTWKSSKFSTEEQTHLCFMFWETLSVQQSLMVCLINDGHQSSELFETRTFVSSF